MRVLTIVFWERCEGITCEPGDRPLNVWWCRLVGIEFNFARRVQKLLNEVSNESPLTVEIILGYSLLGLLFSDKSSARTTTNKH